MFYNKTYFSNMFSPFLRNYWGWGAVSKSAASAASPDYVKFQAVIKSAASAASSGRLDHGLFFFATFGRASGPKIVKISDFDL